MVLQIKTSIEMSTDSESGKLRRACEAHSRHLVVSVIEKLRHRSDILFANKTQTLGKLQQLWLSNMDSTDGTGLTSSARLDETTVIAMAPVVKHARLREDVPRIPSVQGCRGAPAQFMKRPKYACDAGDSKQNAKQSKRQHNNISSQTPVSSTPVDLRDVAVSDDNFSDLLIGMKLLVNLPAILREKGALSTTLSDRDKWLEGRVVALEAAGASASVSAGKGPSADQTARSSATARVRFRNGAEAEVRWPGSGSVVRIAAEQHWGAGAGSSSSSAVVGPPPSASSARRAGNDTAAAGAFSEEQSAERALRILLGELDGCEDLLGAADSDSEEEGGGGLVEQHHAGAARAGTQVLSALGLESSHRAGEFRGERLLLATGERVLSSQLREIEQKFSDFRPRFIITPQQGELAEEEDAEGRAGRAGFVSRRWTAPVRRAESRRRELAHSASALPGEQDNADQQAMEGLLAEREDPSVPLPEPQVVIIGRASKKLRRREDCWSTALLDVYVRDLRQWTPQGSHSGRTGDLLVPRCSLRLHCTQGSDPQQSENARLLRELLGDRE